jgi:hypothetical protein
VATIRTTCFNIKRPCILPTDCICAFLMLLRAKTTTSVTALTAWSLWWRCNMFYTKHEINFYILFRQSSGFNGLILYIMHFSGETWKRTHLGGPDGDVRVMDLLRHRTWGSGLDKIGPEKTGFLEHVNETSDSVKSREFFILVGPSSEEQVCSMDCMRHVGYITDQQDLDDQGSTTNRGRHCSKKKSYADIWTVFFVGYFTTLSVAGLCSSNSRMTRIMNWKGFKRKQFLPNTRNVLAFWLDEPNKTIENSGQTVLWLRFEPKPPEYESRTIPLC